MLNLECRINGTKGKQNHSTNSAQGRVWAICRDCRISRHVRQVLRWHSDLPRLSESVSQTMEADGFQTSIRNFVRHTKFWIFVNKGAAHHLQLFLIYDWLVFKGRGLEPHGWFVSKHMGLRKAPRSPLAYHHSHCKNYFKLGVSQFSWPRKPYLCWFSPQGFLGRPSVFSFQTHVFKI